MPQIATIQIRNRGTIGGSLAHADASAELVAVTTALEARFKIQNLEGERWVPASEIVCKQLIKPSGAPACSAARAISFIVS